MLFMANACILYHSLKPSLVGNTYVEFVIDVTFVIMLSVSYSNMTLTTYSFFFLFVNISRKTLKAIVHLNHLRQRHKWLFQSLGIMTKILLVLYFSCLLHRTLLMNKEDIFWWFGGNWSINGRDLAICMLVFGCFEASMQKKCFQVWLR